MITAAEASGHAAHVGALLGPVLLLAFWAGWSDLRAWMHRQGDELCSLPILLSVVMSTGAGVIHLLVAPAHVSEDPLYGAFFAAAAAGQLAWSALVIRRPHRGVLLAGAAGNLLLIALWAQTRLIAVPLGVAAGTRESAGALDITCVLLEAAVVVFAASASVSVPSAAGRSAPG